MTKKCIVIVDLDGDSVPYNVELTDEQIVELDGHADIYSIISDGKLAVVLVDDKIEWHPINNTTYGNLREWVCRDCYECRNLCDGEHCSSCDKCDNNE